MKAESGEIVSILLFLKGFLHYSSSFIEMPKTGKFRDIHGKSEL